MEIFYYQSEHCGVYKQYLQFLKTDITKINKLEEIPYLPIEFFKYFDITTNKYIPEITFESSSTTGTGTSKHLVKSTDWYKQSFKNSFKFSWLDSSNYCHLALLPSYLERGNSSLVFQINEFIETSIYNESGFYLYNHSELAEQLQRNELLRIPTILWGVTYALLDFAEAYSMTLNNTQIIETGGMKGKRKEIVREELHGILKSSFNLRAIAGEYGMTELMSQAYSISEGLYQCPTWMRVTTREINDPFAPNISNRNGVLNIIDLANLYTCAFIATSDIGKVNNLGQFQVLGRLDNSDTRGCNLLV